MVGQPPREAARWARRRRRCGRSACRRRCARAAAAGCGTAAGSGRRGSSGSPCGRSPRRRAPRSPRGERGDARLRGAHLGREVMRQEERAHSAGARRELAQPDVDRVAARVRAGTRRGRGGGRPARDLEVADAAPSSRSCPARGRAPRAARGGQRGGGRATRARPPAGSAAAARAGSASARCARSSSCCCGVLVRSAPREADVEVGEVDRRRPAAPRGSGHGDAERCAAAAWPRPARGAVSGAVTIATPSARQMRPSPAIAGDLPQPVDVAWPSSTAPRPPAARRPGGARPGGSARQPRATATTAAIGSASRSSSPTSPVSASTAIGRLCGVERLRSVLRSHVVADAGSCPRRRRSAARTWNSLSATRQRS